MSKLSGLVITIIAVIVITAGCSQKEQPRFLSSSDSLRIITEIFEHRSEVDSFFRFDPSSPFRQDSAAYFDSIKWFPPDVNFFLTSKLYRYENPQPITILGTKGEERKQIKYGYFLLNLQRKEIRLNVYKHLVTDLVRNTSLQNYLSVWFTDQTTGKETYEVGRYLDVGEEQSDRNALYVINFNNAYNPYCSYSPQYSCAIPSREDYLDVAILAGEKKYHP